MNSIEDQEVKRHRAASRRLVKEFRALGAEPVMDIAFFASELPDEEALYGLWQHVRELPLRSGLSPAAACDALNDVITARNNYDLGVRSQPFRHIRFTRSLSEFARKQPTQQIISLLDRRAADRERGPSILVALWKGAQAARLARDTDAEGKPVLGVKIAGKWRTLRGDSERGLRRLAEDPVAFAAAAQMALNSAHKNSRQDWQRPLRDLKKIRPAESSKRYSRTALATTIVM